MMTLGNVSNKMKYKTLLLYNVTIIFIGISIIIICYIFEHDKMTNHAFYTKIYNETWDVMKCFHNTCSHNGVCKSCDFDYWPNETGYYPVITSGCNGNPITKCDILNNIPISDILSTHTNGFILSYDDIYLSFLLFGWDENSVWTVSMCNRTMQVIKVFDSIKENYKVAYIITASITLFIILVINISANCSENLFNTKIDNLAKKSLAKIQTIETFYVRTET
jgi:hypothetical protein